MGSKGDVKHSVCVFFAWHGLESCWCFGLFESDADETLSSHRSESTFLLVVICAFRTVFCLAEARLLLAFGCFGTEALFFMGSKGDMKHSVCVFFAWHGLESCWCFGLFESDADETLSSHRSESTFLLVVIFAFRTVFCLAEARLLWGSPLFFMGSKGDVKHSVCVFFAWHGLESCWCFGLFESDADETLSSHRSESTFLLVVICAFRTVFCLAEARLLLAFGCFGTEALFFMGSKGDVKHSVCVFFAWHGLESCWCFGLFESDADETLSSHRSESTFLLVVICAFRTVFCLAEARLLLAFGCFGTEALFFMGSKGDVKHSVCVFFAWHGLESCWCFGLFESDADETLSSHRSESTFLLVVIFAFRTVFCFAEARLLLAFGCFGTEALFFMGSKGDVKHSVCAFFAWHGLESCWCFGLFESDRHTVTCLSSFPR